MGLGGYIEKAKKMVDVITFPYQCLDRYNLDIPALISLHDIQQEHYPEFFTRREIKWRAIICRRSAELSTWVIVSYEHIKKDIVKFYNLPSDKTDVCGWGFEKPPDVNEEGFLLVRNRYNIPEEYIIYSAQTWPHKNHIRLIQALNVLHKKYNKKISLVCTGKKNKYYKNIKKEIISLNLDRHIIFTDYVSDNELLVLLKKAQASVIPTLYEAGSYPLVEAMAVGTPIICSNVTSLPEQIGDRKFTFNPYDVEELASKLYMILTDKESIKENIASGKVQIGKLSWDKKILNLIDSYKKAIADFHKARGKRL